ncbi:MAG: hypothetical protein ABJA76_09505 [Mucilaginibacter sp.]
MSKSDKRVLLKYLEKLYVTKLFSYNFYLKQMKNDAGKTKQIAYERRFRLEIKAIELILYKLGSKFMADVKIINHRKTSETIAGTTGLIKD